MGKMTRETLELQFDKRLRLEFHGARITPDAGLLACQELDGVLGLTEMAPGTAIPPSRLCPPRRI